MTVEFCQAETAEGNTESLAPRSLEVFHRVQSAWAAQSVRDLHAAFGQSFGSPYAFFRRSITKRKSIWWASWLVLVQARHAHQIDFLLVSIVNFSSVCSLAMSNRNAHVLLRSEPKYRDLLK